MTVTSTETRKSYDGNGTTTVFSFPYKFFEADDLLVYTFNEATEEMLLLTLNIDYTTTGAGLDGGGAVTTTVAPAAGLTLVIVNDPDIVQEFDYVNADDFPAESHEEALDRLTKICQRLSDRIDRCVSIPDASPEPPPTLEDVEQLSNEAAASAELAAASATAAATSASEIEANATQIATDAATAAVEPATNQALAARDDAVAAAADAETAKTAAEAAVGPAQAAATAAAASATAADTSADAAADSAAAADVEKIVWRSAWSGAASYAVNDAVSSAGSSYICKLAHTNHVPPNVTYWDVLAQKGADGSGGAGSGDMLRANNLSDVVNADTSLQNLNVENWFLSKAGTSGTATPVKFAREDHTHAALAPLASPVFTGDPKAPTPSAGDNDTSVATTAFVKSAIDVVVGSGLAPLASPVFTGNPTAPTPAANDNDTSVATTAFVTAAIATQAAIAVTNIADGIVTFAKMAAAALATTAEYLANTASKILTTDKVWAAASQVTLTDAATVTPDFSTGINFGWTIGAAGRTLANPTNTKNGQTGIILLQQDATGNRTITTWGTNYKFPSGTKPTLSTGGFAIDIVAYSVVSSTWIACSVLTDMK